MKQIKLNKDEERLVSVLGVLGEKTRYKIFKLMRRNDEMCVSEIADALGVSTPAVSQHFKIFELTGLVDKERNGQKICYKLRHDDPIIQAINTQLKEKES